MVRLTRTSITAETELARGLAELPAVHDFRIENGQVRFDVDTGTSTRRFVASRTGEEHSEPSTDANNSSCATTATSLPNQRQSVPAEATSDTLAETYLIRMVLRRDRVRLPI